jgi:hypothetical protein
VPANTIDALLAQQLRDALRRQLVLEEHVVPCASASGAPKSKP